MNDTHPECNLCRSGAVRLRKSGVYGNPAQSIHICESCGHTFLWPLLTDAEEEEFYIQDYPAFLLKRGDVKCTSPEEHFRRNGGEARRRFPFIRPLLSPTARVLEIGSASGFFLDFLRPHVGELLGVEPNADHAAHANAKNIPTVGDLREVKDRRFDLIFSYYVLEHVKDPSGFVNVMAQLLASPESILVTEIPNGQEALVSFYKSKAYDEFVWQRAHCSYFSVPVLKHLFENAGFESEFIPVQRYDISNHMHWLIEGKPGGQAKYTEVYSEALNQEYQKCLCNNWLCDSILVFSRPTRRTK